MNIGFDEDDIKIDTEGGKVPGICVNGVRYSANGCPVKIFRAVLDNDGDFWIERLEGEWILMKKDTLRKGSLGELAERHGPLHTD